MAASGFWQGKRVLVTGHTGFKGSWLSLWLQSLGAEVSGIALAPTGDRNLFELADVARGGRSSIIDIRNLDAVLAAFRESRPEIVLHLAAQALVRPSYRDPVGTYATNVMGTVHVLEAARVVGGVRSFVVVTSDKCYENREWVWGYRENEPMGGHDPYSNSKGCSELVTSAYRRSFFSEQGAMGLASGRAGNVIGGGDWAEDRIIPDCMRALENGKTIQVRNPGAVRPWQHVIEPLSGYMHLARKIWEQPEKYSEGWNFGPELADTKPVSWIADYVVSRWGGNAKWEHVKLEKAPHEAHSLRLDCSHARADLGWAPRLNLQTCLDWTVDWYRRFAQGEKARDLILEQVKAYEKLGADSNE